MKHLPLKVEVTFKHILSRLQDMLVVFLVAVEWSAIKDVLWKLYANGQ